MDNRALAHQLTGMVAGGLGVEPDYETGVVRCDRCRQQGVQRQLTAGSAVVVAFRNYEGHTWEPMAVCCPEHNIETVSDVMDVDADDQAVVAATLEPTGYRDPNGTYHPAALSIGGVEILDYSPAVDGY